MAARRPIYRKEKPRSVFKPGLVLCLLLAGGVMLVPASGGLMQMGKAKVRDWALNAGIIAFDDCVVTAERTLACSSHAVGTPLAVALRQIEDSKAEAAEEKAQRLKAEDTVHKLARELDRVSAELKQAELAAGSAGFFPHVNGEVRPAGLSVTNPGAGGTKATGAKAIGAQPKPALQATEPSLTLMPPSEEE